MYSKLVPDKLQDDKSLISFLKVLDLTEQYKTIQVQKFCDSFNKKVLLGKNEYSKLIREHGFGNVPNFLVKEQLDALYLNSMNILKLKGSIKGLRLWLWALTLGDIQIDASAFLPQGNYFILSDLTYGYYSNYVAAGDSIDIFYIKDVDNYGQSTLVVEIDTPYYAQAGLYDYILAELKNYIGFYSLNASISLTLNSGSYTNNLDAYQYFTYP